MDKRRRFAQNIRVSAIGTVQSLWRYPVKSMRGQELESVFVGFGGVAGDRRFAFTSTAARADFPYFTARQQAAMLKFVPRFVPPNEQSITVETPEGETLALDDPRLIELLRCGADQNHRLTLVHADAAMADCHPISIISLQTIRQLADETATPPNKRRFRANFFIDLRAAAGFAEDNFVGASLRIGREVVVSIVKRDGRCVIINLDPETAAANPALLKQVAQAHGGTAGIYGRVLVEGTVRRGDEIEVLEHVG
ncbi:MAG: MOSC domain-containing protein [Verrucomicrobiota bacterium]|nr:MOSC domain-containing protein [Verrucomicrobiota bacterium]